jgi:GMP synthase-like glutamine amidotransferase
MSHWDSVVKMAENFEVIWATDDCAFGATESVETSNYRVLKNHA